MCFCFSESHSSKSMKAEIPVCSWPKWDRTVMIEGQRSSPLDSQTLGLMWTSARFSRYERHYVCHGASLLFCSHLKEFLFVCISNLLQVRLFLSSESHPCVKDDQEVISWSLTFPNRVYLPHFGTHVSFKDYHQLRDPFWTKDIKRSSAYLRVKLPFLPSFQNKNNPVFSFVLHEYFPGQNHFCIRLWCSF